MGPEKLEGKKRALQANAIFSQSEYGQSLNGQPRWDMQRPAHVSPAEWIKILGRDTDNLAHMKLSYDITNLFVHYDDGSLNINEEEKDILRLAAISHDWGESIDPDTGLGGDVNYELKTSTQAEDELIMYRKVFDSILGNVDVKTKFIIESTVFKKDTKLGLIFDAVERLGYLRTAKIAFEASRTTDDPILKGNLEWLAAGTLSNQIITLMEYSADYTPVRKYLEFISPFIDDVYGSVDATVFKDHNQPQIEKKNLYNQSKAAWKHGFSHAPQKRPQSTTSVFNDQPNFEARFVESYDDLTKKVEACRTLGMKIVLTSGSFDLLHIGHMRYIEKAKEFGDILILGVDSDEKIRGRKGPDRPVVDETERMQMLSHTRSVDFITLKQASDTKWQLIKAIRPDILIATAETYTPEEITELESNHCGRVVVLEPQATTSTSARIRRLNIGWSRKIIEPLLNDIEEGIPAEALRKKYEHVFKES
ncbi:MAG: adenylyltransferase/cytidyltransferase family protein [Candidatus Microsaccharimonas sp.]